MSFLRPLQIYHSQADPIWPDGTFNWRRLFCKKELIFVECLEIYTVYNVYNGNV
jgi:hypothetical protein